MKKVHLLIADLFLPKDVASEVCAGLHLPALEKILARSKEGTAITAMSLDEALCRLFGLSGDVGVAPVCASFDGLEEGIWMRADPVHVRLQREQVVLLPDITISPEETQQFCLSLNAHFQNEGMMFFAPHPQRWYVKLYKQPDITTVSLSQASGNNIHGNLPKGLEARFWHQRFNEIQMLLYSHPVNENREARGELTVNSLWFWGNGVSGIPVINQFNYVCSNEVLVEILAAGAKLPCSKWLPAWQEEADLLVWTGLRAALQAGNLSAWRDALQEFETGYAQPLWKALCRGKIQQLQIDILGGEHPKQLNLSRADCLAVWRRPKNLANYS